jgi:hypothetical protein
VDALRRRSHVAVALRGGQRLTEAVDIGELAEGWRAQRDTPAYVRRYDVAGLREALAAAKRYRDM